MYKLSSLLTQGVQDYHFGYVELKRANVDTSSQLELFFWFSLRHILFKYLPTNVSESVGSRGDLPVHRIRVKVFTTTNDVVLKYGATASPSPIPKMIPVNNLEIKSDNIIY